MITDEKRMISDAGHRYKQALIDLWKAIYKAYPKGSVVEYQTDNMVRPKAAVILLEGNCNYESTDFRLNLAPDGNCRCKRVHVDYIIRKIEYKARETF